MRVYLTKWASVFRSAPHSEDLLKEQLAHGAYHTPEEVIERALENLAASEGSAGRRRTGGSGRPY